ncbi:hypothetical protein V6N11_044282 [Hibiscus sabdariffa]|uniref:Uncharacterized protein n=1 Tax=Hibiscus sabdariffa TaxID=183260 RepID=A0ABR2REQ9_9ROSI
MTTTGNPSVLLTPLTTTRHPSVPMGPSSYENPGGRPPELPLSVSIYSAKERSASQSLLDDQRMAKKGKNVDDQDTSMVAGTGVPDATKSTLYASGVSEGIKDADQDSDTGFVGDKVEISAEDVIMNRYHQAVKIVEGAG